MIEEALRSHLVALPALAALVGERVSPWTVPHGAELPAVTYHVVSGTFPITHEGSAQLAWHRVQLDCWGASFADAIAVATAIQDAMNGYAGPLGALQARGCQVVGILDDYDPETGVYRRTLDLGVWTQEA